MSQALFYSLAGAILLGLFLLEVRSPSFRRGAGSDARRARRNWAYLISNVVTLLFIGVAAHYIPMLVPKLVRADSIGVVDFAGCLIAGELFNYGIHVAMHKVPYLWRFHFQHHRETNYDIWLASHLHALESFASACCMSAIFSLLGFSVLAKQCYFLFFIFVTTYHHSANRYTLGPLDWLIIGPAYHRLHHAVDVRGNYGSTMTILDRLFGTAVRPDDRPHRYGIDSKREPWGFWREFFYMFRLRRSRPAVAPVLEAVER